MVKSFFIELQRERIWNKHQKDSNPFLIYNFKKKIHLRAKRFSGLTFNRYAWSQNI
jgi:hypothetical protein